MKNKNITLILPTYNRAKYFMRLLEFLTSASFEMDILILDSSIDEIKIENGRCMEKIEPSLKIKRLQYSSTMVGIDKILDGLSKVKTEFVVFCADDDFIMPQGIAMAADFLEKNPDYSVAHGYYLTCSLNRQPNNSINCVIDPEYYTPSWDHGDPVFRLCQHFGHYQATFYGVHRTEKLKENLMKNVRQFPCVSDLFGEVYLSMLDVIHGKIKRLPVFYYCRSFSGPSSGWETWFARDDFSTHYSRFRNGLAAELAGGTDYSDENCRRIIDVFFTNYIMDFCYYLGSDAHRLPLPAELASRYPNEKIARKFEPNPALIQESLCFGKKDFAAMMKLIKKYPVELEGKYPGMA
ncbi:MAG: TIGR00180 family glycosyltransferase [Verrucomicrobiae bacterium]|nr:TIGR00180 family glycosyltransferase [Verrucomicrobiae bacterium]